MNTPSTKLVSVVIPCYNEVANLPILAAQVQASLEKLPGYRYECLFVDDGSADETQAALQELRNANPCLRPLQLVRNMGQSAALVAGLRAAKGDYILTIDGDLQNDPADFPTMLNLLQTHSCVCVYRAVRNDSWIRRLSSRCANRVRNLVLRDGIRDTGCGTKGFRRECIPYIIPFNGVHRFFAVMIRNAGLDIAEFPATHHPRIHGLSKYGIHNRLWRGLFDLVGVYWLRKRFVHPKLSDESVP